MPNDDLRAALTEGPWEEASITSSRCKYCGILWIGGRKEPMPEKHEASCIYRALATALERLEAAERRTEALERYRTSVKAQNGGGERRRAMWDADEECSALAREHPGGTNG